MKPEASVQQRVVAIYRAAGATVCNLAQGYRPGGRRHGTTRQTKGIPDLYVFLPRRELAWWHEVKAPHRLDLAFEQMADADRAAMYRKKQTPEQVLFELLCRECQVAYILGGALEAHAFLQTIGIIPTSATLHSGHVETWGGGH